MPENYVPKSALEHAAQVVDLPQDEFEKQVVEHKLNLGQINSLRVFLEMLYQQTCVNKDAVVASVCEGRQSKDDPKVKSTLEGLYAVMTSIELKVVYLNKRHKDLIQQAETHD